MAESVEKYGFSPNTVKRIVRFYPDKRELADKFTEIIADDPDISLAQMFMRLTEGRGGKKPHASAKGNTEKPKRRGRGSATPRPGRLSRY